MVTQERKVTNIRLKVTDDRVEETQFHLYGAPAGLSKEFIDRFSLQDVEFVEDKIPV